MTWFCFGHTIVIHKLIQDNQTEKEESVIKFPTETQRP